MDKSNCIHSSQFHLKCQSASVLSLAIPSLQILLLYASESAEENSTSHLAAVFEDTEPLLVLSQFRATPYQYQDIDLSTFGWSHGILRHDQELSPHAG